MENEDNKILLLRALMQCLRGFKLYVFCSRCTTKVLGHSKALSGAKEIKMMISKDAETMT